jgi:hypothetical protein
MRLVMGGVAEGWHRGTALPLLGSDARLSFENAEKE